VVLNAGFVGVEAERLRSPRYWRRSL
jgi:hypothetical protein